MYRLENADDSEAYIEGTAADILDALIRYGVRFVDTDGSTLRVVLL